MPSRDPRTPLSIVILGPMEQRKDGQVTAQSRTLDLKSLVEGIVADIQKEPAYRDFQFRVAPPESNDTHLIVQGVLNLIEDSGLAIVDFSDNTPNVAYEAGIIHALGVPHILTTRDPTTPFYFRTVQHIANLQIDRARGYVKGTPVHDDLRKMILSFISDTSATSGYSDSQIAQYYGNLPIVDIAGPSGLAAGYYRNAIRRFVRSGGFVEAPCDIVWTSRFEKDAAGVETRHTDRRQIDIKHVIFVRPPGDMIDSYPQDSGALEEALKKAGLRTVLVTVQKRKDEFQDMRDFSGFMLAYAGAKDEPVRFVEPGIMVDMPTTLYALDYSPRVQKLNRLSSVLPHKALRARKRTMLRDMLAAFERNLNYQLAQERPPARMDAFRIVDVAGLEPALREMGVLR
jgi:hypothetical protein